MSTNNKNFANIDKVNDGKHCNYTPTKDNISTKHFCLSAQNNGNIPQCCCSHFHVCKWIVVHFQPCTLIQPLVNNKKIFRCNNNVRSSLSRSSINHSINQSINQQVRGVTHGPCGLVLWWISFHVTTLSRPEVVDLPIVKTSPALNALLSSWQISSPSALPGR